MAQEKEKKNEVNSSADRQQKKKKRKSISNSDSNQITISREEAAKVLSSFQHKEKKKNSEKGIVVMEPEPEPSNNITDEMDVDQPMETHFQDEILTNILERLPVQSLLRFKGVSKSWKTLISEPYFKMTHLNHAKISHKFLVAQRCPKDRIHYMYSFPLSPLQPVENARKLEFPLISRPVICSILCCCDGLVIIIVNDNNDNIDVGRNIHLLWNPSTGESIVLPHARLEKSSRLGMGYDPTSGDYKIVKIQRDIYNPGEIIALKSGSWRNIDKHPRGICNNVIDGTCSLPFVNEAFHWIGRGYSATSRNYSVVSFSISSEMYGEIPLPEQILCLRDKISIGVSVLDGMLCVHSLRLRQREDSFKLWVLKDYGVKESWNALAFKVDDPGLYFAVPEYMFEDGEVLFWGLRINHNGHSFRTSKGPFELWPRCDTYQTGIVFTESLISPKSLI